MNLVELDSYYVVNPISLDPDAKCGFCHGRLYKKASLAHAGHCVGHTQCIKNWVAFSGVLNCAICQKKMGPIPLLPWKERQLVQIKTFFRSSETVALTVGALLGAAVKWVEGGVLPSAMSAALAYASLLAGMPQGKRVVQVGLLKGLEIAMQVGNLTLTGHETEDEEMGKLHKYCLAGVLGGVTTGLMVANATALIACKVGLLFDTSYWPMRLATFGLAGGVSIGACAQSCQVVIAVVRAHDKEFRWLNDRCNFLYNRINQR